MASQSSGIYIYIYKVILKVLDLFSLEFYSCKKVFKGLILHKIILKGFLKIISYSNLDLK